MLKYKSRPTWNTYLVPEAAVFWQMEEVSRIQLNLKKVLELLALMLTYKN